MQDERQALRDANHGTVTMTLRRDRDRDAEVEPPAGEAKPKEPKLALPLPGTDGNRACEVRPMTALQVPCAMCGEVDGTLSFFDMVVPHFGGAELLSFSCSDCGYKYNKVTTAVGQPVGPKGRTLKLRALCGADLRREIVTSDVATVRLEELDVEVQSTGRYSTVEGLVTSLGSGLSRAVLASDTVGGDDEDGLGGLLTRISELIAACERGEGALTLSIIDPLAMSFISEPPGAHQHPQWHRHPSWHQHQRTRWHRHRHP